MASHPDTYPSSPFRSMPFFLSVFVLFWLLGSMVLFQMGYQESFLFLNAFRSSIADSWFPHLTHLGDGVFLTGVFGLLILPKRKALFVSLILVLVLVSIAISLSKSYLFSTWNRPLGVFPNESDFYYVSLDRLTRRSFPSGHSAAAAAMFTVFAYAWEQRRAGWGILLACIALTIAYTRLYIGVHFWGDILLGTFLGVAIALGVLEFAYPRLKVYFDSRSTSSQRRWQVGLYIFIAVAFLGNLFRLATTYYL